MTGQPVYRGRRRAVLLMALVLAGCSRGRDVAPESVELPGGVVTHWTSATELFMEHPTLVTGQTALFAVHLTRLGDFAPVAEGRASLQFTPESGGAPTTLAGPAPTRPGAFRIEDTAPGAGRYRWALVLEGTLSDRHDLGTITVYADAASARSAIAPPDDPAAIAYLKEQQWTNPFATAVVEEADLRASLRAPAVVHPLPGGEALVSAPAAGRVMTDVLPSIGDRVRAGQVLARLEPRSDAGADRATLEADVADARASVDATRTEQTRAERLLTDRAVPARRVEDARRAADVAGARLRAADARLAQRDEVLRQGGGVSTGNAYVLRAPIAGRLSDVMVTPGATYDGGAPLFRIVRTDRVELEVQVPAPDAVAARRASGLALELPGLDAPLVLDAHHVHDAGVLDPRTGALPLQMEVANPGERLLIGQAGTALLFTRATVRVPAVPRAAVLMDAGRPFVFVQVGGERFARRFIEVAARDGDLVGVASGVARGERVVVRGAYDVQLASAATGLSAEGHVH